MESVATIARRVQDAPSGGENSPGSDKTSGGLARGIEFKLDEATTSIAENLTDRFGPTSVIHTNNRTRIAGTNDEANIVLYLDREYGASTCDRIEITQNGGTWTSADCSVTLSKKGLIAGEDIAGTFSGTGSKTVQGSFELTILRSDVGGLRDLCKGELVQTGSCTSSPL